MQDLLTFWYERVASDLQGFTDVGIEPKISIEGPRLRAEWQFHERRHEVFFSLSDAGDFRWHDGKIQKPYSAFLASSFTANLAQLAAATSRKFKEHRYKVPLRAHINETHASGSSEQGESLIKDIIRTSIGQNSGRTKIIFLKGDAGAGKTTLLRYLTYNQALQYASNGSSYLYLYVSAQGRALSNLRDAIAGETQDLRAALTYHAVGPLTRNALLVPVIDGFDELLGATGYGDAFGSLSDFLSRLGGEGTVIVSARSTFYDTEFVARAQDTGPASYEVVVVETEGWSDDDINKYLGQARGADTIFEEDASALRNLTEPDRALLRKPFFASRFPAYVDSVSKDHFSGHLVEYLLESFVQRESGKIVDRDGKSLLDVKGHRRLFELCAGEMWETENRSLGAAELRCLAELVADESGLSSDSASQLINKITSYAGFALDSGGQFRFEHEIYFDHFLSNVIQNDLNQRTSVTFLDRGIIPKDVAERVAANLSDFQSSLTWALAQVDTNVLRDNRRRNVALIYSEILRVRGSASQRTIANLLFFGNDFGFSKIENVDFFGCSFTDVSWINLHMIRCKFTECIVYSASVGPRTRLEVQGLSPGENVLFLRHVDTGEQIRSPERLRSVMRELGTKLPADDVGSVVYSNQGQAVLKILPDLVQKFSRTNALHVDVDQSATRAIARDPNWPTLLRILLNSGCLKMEARQASGPKREFLRPNIAMTELTRHERNADLPAGPVGAFWRAVRAL